MHLLDLLHYWRASLLDGQRHLDVQAVTARTCEAADVGKGLLPPELTRDLWRDAETALPREERTGPTRPVLILPAVLNPRVEHASSIVRDRRRRVPVWVPALLDEEGRLTPAPADPLIDRDILAPLGGNAVTFGSVAAQGAFLASPEVTSQAQERRTSWAALWGHVEALFQAVFDTPFAAMGPPHYTNGGCEICVGRRPIDTTRHVGGLYDALITGLSRKPDPIEPPPLLLRLTREAPPIRCAPAEAGRRHLAQMDARHPLNPGQREALRGVLDSRTGEITAVNGPPGTGKTTLLQSIIGSLWVEAAVDGAEPPVIVATSTNNQAITNILDSFAGVEGPEAADDLSRHLLTRWLPEVTAYGLYFPSQAKAEGSRDRYQVAEGTSHQWGGLPAVMETAEFVERATAAYLEAASTWAGAPVEEVSAAVARLHKDLTRNVTALRAATDQRAALADLLAGFSGRTPEDALAEEQALAEARRKDRDLERAKARADLEETTAAARLLEHHAEEALRQIEPASLAEMLLAWLPSMKRRLSDRARRYLAEAQIADSSWGFGTLLTPDGLRAWLDDRRALLQRDPQAAEARDTLRRLDEEVARDNATVAELRARVERWTALREEWTASLRSLVCDAQPDAWLADEEAFEGALDLQVRPWLFHLAARYWEGRWILDAEEALKQPKGFTGQARRIREAGLRRFCKLTPCLVATTHMLPRQFEFFERPHGAQPLLKGIDLLIVEEAGQVPVDVGAAGLALAKRAVIVGDKDQIEPVWSVSPAMDVGNASERGLDFEVLSERGLTTSSGSMMMLARAATAVASEGEEGLFLADHWRCRPGVIAFCNDLVYRRRLIPRRPAGDAFLPPLGYAHVPGRAERSGTSRRNRDEAAVIAKWLKGRRDELTARYGTDDLGGIAAIITPFKAQIPVLEDALKREGLGRDRITVGTVHALQGAQRPLVLFSPVYGADHEGGLFFDNGPNMLNVAVSRAQDSFLVFGAMGHFRADGANKPSSVLARLMYADPDNEITDIEPLGALSGRRRPGAIDRIDSLAGHRDILRQAIETAEKRLLIVSPFLSRRALDADDLAPLVAAAAKRGVMVRVVADELLNLGGNGVMRPAAREAMDILKAAGAEVRTVAGIHAKTLAVDHAWLAEGSFNWLSASRDRGSDWQRSEASLVYRGAEAEEMVREAWLAVEKLGRQAGEEKVAEAPTA